MTVILVFGSYSNRKSTPGFAAMGRRRGAKNKANHKAGGAREGAGRKRYVDPRQRSILDLRRLFGPFWPAFSNIFVPKHGFGSSPEVTHRAAFANHNS
jgi:hypothetical protein